MIKRKHALQLAICIALIMVLVAGVLQVSSAKAVTTTCTTYSGSNVEGQNYTTWSSPIKSYLYACSDGSIMRVQAGSSIEGVLVEYYDTSYNLKSSKIIATELPVFGGFYAMGGYYYLLTGQNNPSESDSTEVFRITKYDTSWKKIGSASLYGANTYIPFDAGSARFASTGKYLLIRTAHEMYMSSDGNHHQANVTIEVDTSTMTVTDSYTIVMNKNYGYVSHSFNQFIQIENNKIVSVDHGDALPRSVVLMKYNTDVTTGKFQDRSVNYTNLLSFEDEVTDWYNYTGASVGGFEISDSAYLVVGNQDIGTGLVDRKNYVNGRNIFVAVQDKSTGAVSVKYLTNYTSGTGTTSTPHLVKISSNNYLVLWSRGTTVYYTQIDGSGKQIGTTYSMAGSLSDCVPIVVSGKIIWYTWNNGTITFYEIPVSNLPLGGKSTVIENGHQYKYGTDVSADGTLTMVCKQCGESSTISVPTAYSVWWKDKAASGSYYSGYRNWVISGTNDHLPVGMELECWMRYADSYSGQYGDVVVESSNPDVISVGADATTTYPFGFIKCLTMKKPGISVITLYPKYNPGIAKTYLMRVGENSSVNISTCTATLSQSKYTYTGSEFKPTVTVKSGNVTLVENTDYTISYSNNTNVGTATVTITGKGLFSGTLVKNFTIEGIKISASDVKLGTSSYIYNGSEKKPSVTVTTGGNTLKNGTDYTVTYSSNTNIGTATVTITGIGNYAGTVSKTFEILPGEVQNLTTTPGDKSVTLAWDAVSGADGYKVYRYNATKGSWIQIATVSSCSYVDEGQEVATTYKYYVRAYKTVSGTIYMSPTYMTQEGTTYLDNVTGITVASEVDGVTISWKKVTGAEKYRVFYKISGDSGWSKLADTTSTSYTWTGAASGTTYAFTVRCISKDKSTYTSSYDKTGKSITYIAAPKLSSVSATGTGIQIKWGAVTGAAKYRVFYKTSNGNGWSKIADTTSTSYTWTGAKSGTTYIFTIRCLSKDGSSYTSSYDSVGKSITYIVAPKLGTISNTTEGVQIKWGAVDGAAKYRVFYKTSSDSGWSKLADTSSTSYTWTGAKSGTTYIFTVRCLSSDGKNYTSSYDTTGKSITYIENPKISSVSNAKNGVQIKWGAVTGATKYRVFYKTTSDSGWSKIADTTATSYTWTGAESGTTYIFTVRCLSSDGASYTSSYDATGKSITYLAAPEISTLSNVSNGIQIKWGAVDGAVKYRVFYKTSSDSGWTKLKDTTSTNYTWTEAKSGTTYIFTVRCISSDGANYTSNYDSTGKTIKYTK